MQVKKLLEYNSESPICNIQQNDQTRQQRCSGLLARKAYEISTGAASITKTIAYDHKGNSKTKVLICANQWKCRAENQGLLVPSREDFISYKNKKPWAFKMGLSTVGKTSGVITPQTTYQKILSHHSP